MGSDPTRIQFFIRTNSSRMYIANSTDSIRSIHERIQSSTGIPVTKQRLIYRGNQLPLDRTLSECGVQNDAELQLVGRIGSTEHARAWDSVNDILSHIRYLAEKKTTRPPVSLKTMVMEFLNFTPQNDVVKASVHLQIFASSFAPQALVMLYTSSYTPNVEVADEAIREFISFSNRDLPEHTHHHQCLPIVSEFHSWLTKAATPNDPLYELCSSTLRDIVGCSECEEKKRVFSLQISIFRELVAGLSRDSGLCAKTPPFSGPSPSLVTSFTNYFIHLREEIEGNLGFRDPIAIPLCWEHVSCTEAIIHLHGIFVDLLSKLEKWLVKIEKSVTKNGEPFHLGGGAYLRLLKVLYNISKLYSGCKDVFWEILKQRKSDFSRFVVFHAKWFEHDYNLLLEFKELINFEARKRLSMVMLPQMKHTGEGLLEMLISRSHLLAESFEYIAHADLQSLRSGLSVVFKNEEATGHGVRREWFLLVCKELVNPLNSLFLACPNDQRRIFPNPASGVDPLHLEYFSFCGRMIALALMHNVQVGIVFDRVFFLQLARRSISLEDIRDADPYLYRSCKQILDMDPEVVDQDALGLTFVHEVEEMGTKKVFELCPGGRSMVVNSKNRNEFVDSLIKHRFVTAISEQVIHFAKDFSDIMSSQGCHHTFFRCLDLEDLDWMLHGSESVISVDDWKAHTDYRGFKKNNPQISWFWENVSDGETTMFQRCKKFIPVCHNCGVEGHICPYCYQYWDMPFTGKAPRKPQKRVAIANTTREKPVKKATVTKEKPAKQIWWLFTTHDRK